MAKEITMGYSTRCMMIFINMKLICVTYLCVCVCVCVACVLLVIFIVVDLVLSIFFSYCFIIWYNPSCFKASYCLV